MALVTAGRRPAIQRQLDLAAAVVAAEHQRDRPQVLAEPVAFMAAAELEGQTLTLVVAPATVALGRTEFLSSSIRRRHQLLFSLFRGVCS